MCSSDLTRYVLAALVLVAAGVAWPARGGEDKPPAIGEIMRKLNGGTNSMTRNLELDLKEDEPDWEAIQESTAEYAKLVATLEKGKPPLGGKESWERLARGYAANARALDAAARRKDRATAAGVVARIKNACNACHQVHRPKE